MPNTQWVRDDSRRGSHSMQLRRPEMSVRRADEITDVYSLLMFLLGNLPQAPTISSTHQAAA
jgi:hypothetical protein